MRELEEALAATGTWGERSFNGAGQEPAVDLAPNPRASHVAFEESTPDRQSSVELRLASGETSMPSALLALLRITDRLLMALVLEFANLFALDSSELGCTSTVTHKIETGEHPPVKPAPCQVPFALRGKVCQLVQEMLEQGMIKPSSSL